MHVIRIHLAGDEDDRLVDVNALELVAYALWLIRDIVVPLALFMAVLGLFSIRDRRKAAEVWGWGVLATIATMAVGETKSLFNIPSGLIVFMLVVAGLLIFAPSPRAGGGNSPRTARRANRPAPMPHGYAYRRRDGLLTAAENSFYHTLLQVTDGKIVVCPKVGLWDIFDVEDGSSKLAEKARIDRKHVDFLLCTPQAMKPVCAIELDDSSHDRHDRQERDRFVDEVFRTADLPLVHIRVRRAYNVGELAQMLSPYVGNGALKEKPARDVPPATVRISAEGTPLCPKCGAPMVLRVARRGEHRGEKFYACSTYPKCKSILPTR